MSTRGRRTRTPVPDKPLSRRTASRVPAAGKLRVRVVNLDIVVTLGDISPTGVTLYSPQPFRRGDWFQLQFTTKTGAAVVLPAIVVHSQSIGARRHVSGWQFLPAPFQTQSVRQLLDAVRKAPESPTPGATKPRRR